MSLDQSLLMLTTYPAIEYARDLRRDHLASANTTLAMAQKALADVATPPAQLDLELTLSGWPIGQPPPPGVVVRVWVLGGRAEVVMRVGDGEATLGFGSEEEWVGEDGDTIAKDTGWMSEGGDILAKESGWMGEDGDAIAKVSAWEDEADANISDQEAHHESSQSDASPPTPSFPLSPHDAGIHVRVVVDEGLVEAFAMHGRGRAIRCARGVPTNTTLGVDVNVNGTATQGTTGYRVGVDVWRLGY